MHQELTTLIGYVFLKGPMSMIYGKSLKSARPTCNLNISLKKSSQNN